MGKAAVGRRGRDRQGAVAERAVWGTWVAWGNVGSLPDRPHATGLTGLRNLCTVM